MQPVPPNCGGVVWYSYDQHAGGDTFSNAKISAAMKHAIGVIRAEEDRRLLPGLGQCRLFVPRPAPFTYLENPLLAQRHMAKRAVTTKIKTSNWWVAR